MVRFDEKESISGVQQLKSSVQKGIRARLLELYPHLENYIDQVLPKKDTFRIVKWYVIVMKIPVSDPFFVPMQQVDKGAIRFVLSGANIIAKVNKGVGIENCHYLNDGLWQMKPVK
ncbi:Mct-1 protein [Operophtera brumata]|uniref:Mct-1 protein n=1 Tax=Operophtera brumata TaxID=104452 RepID=A0A0L7LDT7_OPEBR|nr:Mct-1 protein [Operophtera brumata]